MIKRILPKLSLLAGAAALMIGGTSCSETTAASAPQKGALIGAAAGGVVGGVRSKNQHGHVRPLGVGVGAAAGAAGGYFIGKQIEKKKENEARDERLRQLEEQQRRNDYQRY